MPRNRCRPHMADSPCSRSRNAVSRIQCRGLLHTLNIRIRELFLSAHATEQLHRPCHHGIPIKDGGLLHGRFFRHTQKKSRQHGAVDKVHLEPVSLLKFRRQMDGRWKAPAQVPTVSDVSIAMSKDAPHKRVSSHTALLLFGPTLSPTRHQRLKRAHEASA